MSAKPKEAFLTAGATAEQLIHDGPCLVHGIYPQLTTTGTVTLRNTATAAGGTVKSLSAIGLTQAGKTFGGVRYDTGLTVQLSQATDLCTIVWEAL